MSKRMDENQLLESARKGDRDAFRRLVEENSRPMYQLAWRIIGDPELAEDVVQEAFIKAHQQLPNFDNRSKFSTWLYRITTNAAIDMQRKNKRHNIDSIETDEQLFQSDAIPQQELTDKDQLIKSATARVMSELTVQERTAFSLKHYEGHSIAQICDILSASESAVKQAIFRAVKKLRTQLMPIINDQSEEYSS